MANVPILKLGSTLLRMGRLPAPYDTKDIEVWGQSREQWFARREREGMKR